MQPYPLPRQEHPEHPEPSAHPGGPVAASPRPNRTPLLAGVAVVVALAIVGFFVFKALGGASFGGTWYGPASFTFRGSSYSQSGEMFMTLAQDGSTVTGSGELCVVSAGAVQSHPYTASGTANGSSISLTWTPVSTNTGAIPVTLTGSLSGGTLSLTYTNTADNEHDSFTLTQGSHDAYTTACNRLPKNGSSSQ